MKIATDKEVTFTLTLSSLEMRFLLEDLPSVVNPHDPRYYMYTLMADSYEDNK